jgi:hypothetical protein
MTATSDFSVKHNGLDVSLINPKNGSKYSPNLFKWLTKRTHRHRAWTSRVFRAECGDLYIGMRDGELIIGSRLIAVLCNGGGEQSWAYTRLSAAKEITEFWPDYVAIGRCAIDPRHSMHFVNDDSRWSIDGEYRYCLWCKNHSQKQRRWVEQIQRATWEPQEGKA